MKYTMYKNLLPLISLQEWLLSSRQYRKHICNMATTTSETDQLVTVPVLRVPALVPENAALHLWLPHQCFLPVTPTDSLNPVTSLCWLLRLGCHWILFFPFSPISLLIYFSPQDLCKRILQSVQRRNSCMETGSPSTKFQRTDLEQRWPAGEKSWIWAFF